MSANYLSVTVVGSLGKDPEVRSTPSGAKIANFVIPIDQGFGDNKRTEWVNIVAFGKQAEFTEKYLKKGKPVGILGTLQTSSWDDKQTGAKRYKTEVVVKSIDFVDSGGGSGSGERPTRQERAAPAPRQQASPTPRVTEPGVSTTAWDEDNDDIPF